MGGAEDRLGWLGHIIADRYAVDEVAGEGGFGIVYRGRHLGFDEPVAIKCLKLPTELMIEERGAFLADFREEAKLLHRLSRQSIGIVQALDVGAAASPSGIWTPFIVMEWLAGCTLAADLLGRTTRGEHARTPEEMVRLLQPAAEALGVAHENGVAHLDVKPGNLFLVDRDREPLCKVLDFGIAEVLSESDTLNAALSRSGAAAQLCTPQYAAPEQFSKKHGPAGPWTDVFSFALVVIEVLTGRQALDGGTVLQLYVSSVSQHVRPRLAEQGVHASDALEEVLRRALRPHPQARYRDLSAMWRALCDAVGVGGGEARGAPPTPGASRGAMVTTAGPASLSQNRVCTVLFAELVVPRGPSDDDAERLGRMLDRAFDVLHQCVTGLGGATERLMGDVVMAVFGLEGEGGNAAERSVHAALRMIRGLGDLAATTRTRKKPDLRVRVGIDTGRVYATRATDGRLTLSGAAVKAAARLQQAAPAGGVLVARDTHREVVGLFDFETVSLPAGADDTGSRRAWRVLGPARDRQALDVATARDFLGLTTRFVGRAVELETLGGVIDEAQREKRSRLCTLIGAPGVGLSRLLAELGAQLHDQGVFVLGAQCSSLHAQTSYALFATLVRSRFHIHEDDPFEVAVGKLRRAVRTLAGEGADGPVSVVDGRPVGVVDDEEVVRQLAVLLGVRREQPLGVAGHDDRSAQVKQRIAGAVASWLRGARRPVALLCDDVHWADGASLELLEDLQRRLRDTPLVVAVAGDPSFLERRPDWGAHDPDQVRVEVAALPRRHLEAMARDRLRKVEGSLDVVATTLAERAEGSPRALVEMLHLLVDAGVVDAPAEGPWRYAGERLGELRLPTSVQGIVQARLDRLAPDALATICRAAVVGTTFWDGALQAVDPGLHRDALAGILADLAARRLVQARPSSMFPDEQEYAFAERATQQVAYEMLGHETRSDLHRRVARWLERRLPGDAAAPLTAGHHEKAGAFVAAVGAYTRAGNHAAALDQHVEALHWFEQAYRVDALVADDQAEPGEAELDGVDEVTELAWPERASLAVALGDALRRLGRPDDAVARYREASSRVRDDDPDTGEAGRWKARIAHRLALVGVLQGRLDEPRMLSEQAIADGRRGGLTEELAEMWSLLAEVHRRAKDAAASRRASLEGLRVCRGAQRGPAWRQAVSKLLVVLGGSLVGDGKLLPAERCYLQAVRVIDEDENPDQKSRALNNVAVTRFLRGDLHGARESFLRALGLTERSGDLWVRMTTLANIGEVEHRLGNQPVARGYLREAVRLGAEIRAEGDLTDCHRNLAAVHAALGEHDVALDEARRALELAREGGPRRLYLASVLDTLIAIVDGLRPAPPELRPRLDAVSGVLDGLPADAGDDVGEKLVRAKAALHRVSA
jgi:class 3 adenylate cyclase/tetratricopeptide (TPR) repeat protein